jgi:hypothetical protein
MATSGDQVEKLNSFLRGELAAIETYARAFEKVSHFPEKHALVDCQHSHQERAALLRQRILQLGGTPVETSGAWGAFANLIESGAAVLGDGLAIKALEEGEELGLREYRDEALALEGEAKVFVESSLLPQQYMTHRTVSELRASLP